MGLLVYKFSEYDHTAEREQYRSLCKQLYSHFASSQELCIFIANYNIFDSELDGIIIKQDAIICVEFKNYGGKVIATDNGDWKQDDGTIIKGGSRKSVYQQARINRSALKNGFKDGGILPSKVLRDVATLVVFHQPISIQNNLSPKTQSWLHIADESTFMEKVCDITNVNMALENEDMYELMSKLNLVEEYLDKEYSDYEVLYSEKPKPQSKNNQQTFTDEQLKQLWEFDVTQIMPRVPKETKQLYLDTCLLMYKELSRPRYIIDMRIEDIITINGQLYWKYCPKKLGNHEFKNPTKKDAPVEVHKDCIQIIQKYKGNRTKGYLLPFKINQKAETKSRDTDVMHVREKIRKFMCEIDKYYNWNIENLSMYNLRHTVITNAIISGMPIKLIAEYAKTSMLQIENTYSDTIKICRSSSISNVI